MHPQSCVRFLPLRLSICLVLPTMANSLLFHPITVVVASSMITTSTAAFTKRDSLLRYVSFFMCLIIAWMALSNFHDYVQTTGWSGRMLAGAVFTCPLVLFDRLLFRKWAFGQDFLGPIDLPDAEKKKQSRWQFGYEVSASLRCVGSEKEAANVPYFSQENPTYIPSRSSFLLRHASLVLGLYYLNTISVDMQLGADQSLIVEKYVPFFSRISEVSVQEILNRIQISVSYWAAQYCLLQCLYSHVAIINVLLNPRELKFWRPMFGPIKSSYTIRRFWR